MKYAHQLSTAELRALAIQFARPKTTAEALIQRGIAAELAEPDRQEAGFRPETIESVREELEGEIEELKEELDAMSMADPPDVKNTIESKVDSVIAL